MAAAITNSEGCFDGEFSMYFPNSLVKGFECENELNLIKPPMCDGNGAIMFQRNIDDTLSTSKTGRHTLNTSGFLTAAPAGSIGTLQYFSKGGCMFEMARCNELPVQDITNGLSPLNWPSRYNPQHSSIERDFAIEFGSINKPMVLCNLTNTKCIPIGVKCSATVNDPEISTAVNTFTAVDTKYRICYPLISGIWGRLNPKMVATCLMAPQQICINIHLAPAHIALHLSFDPNPPPSKVLIFRVPGAPFYSFKNMSF